MTGGLIHASFELIEAMAGISPPSGTFTAQASYKFRTEVFGTSEAAKLFPGSAVPFPVDLLRYNYGICGSRNSNYVWACRSMQDEDKRQVDCPKCLVAMDAALEGRILEPT